MSDFSFGSFEDAVTKAFSSAAEAGWEPRLLKVPGDLLEAAEKHECQPYTHWNGIPVDPHSRPVLRLHCDRGAIEVELRYDLADVTRQMQEMP